MEAWISQPEQLQKPVGILTALPASPRSASQLRALCACGSTGKTSQTPCPAEMSGCIVGGPESTQAFDLTSSFLMSPSHLVLPKALAKTAVSPAVNPDKLNFPN